MLQTQFDCACSPFFDLLFAAGFGFNFFCEVNQSLRRIGPTIQDYIFDANQQIPVDFVIHFQLLRIHDPHIEPRLNRVIQEGCVHRFTNNIVASEGKRHVAYAT